MKPIGVFDSGVGGLTVVAALHRRLPHLPVLYLGDTARLPYGTKSRETVIRYTRANLRFLLERDVGAVVLACNTASAYALDEVDCRVPLWGVIEPAAREAARVSRAGPIGILATEATIRSGAYSRALRKLRSDVVTVPRACPLFAPLVEEEGWLEDPLTLEIARRYLEPLVAARVETVVLGCTHYPLLAPTLRRILGEEVVLVDSGEAVAAEIAAALPEAEASREPVPASHFCVTDAAERFSRLATRILGGGRVSLELVDLG